MAHVLARLLPHGEQDALTLVIACAALVRLVQRGSGGKGRWRAGDGTLRVIKFLERVQCAILSGFRRMRPFGTKGGEPGEAGVNSVRRKDGTIERLGACAQTTIEPGEAIIIETPTGGGYGSI